MTVRILPLRSRCAGAVLAFLVPGDKPLDHQLIARLPATARASMRAALARRRFTAKPKEVRVVNLPSQTTPAVILIGLGKASEVTRRRSDLCVRAAAAALKSERVSEARVLLSDLAYKGSGPESAIRHAIENIALAVYEFRRYKTGKEKPHELHVLNVLADESDAETTKRGIRIGLVISDALNHCRDLANTPGAEMTPTSLAQDAQVLGRQHGFKVKMLSEKDMKRLGMGAILGVSRGSHEDAKFIIMEYAGGRRPVNPKSPLVFLGKGITFDSGGLNLKPTAGMTEMHMDMSGGAAVMGALAAIAKLKLTVRVIGLVPAVENMPSGTSYHPGDMLRSLSGKTIEVENTDAEGRLLLADALTYAKRYKPQLVVDVATLTGGVLHALGQWSAGVMGKDEKIIDQVRAAGETSGDDLWPLPLWEEHEELVAGTFGDVSNSGKYKYAQATMGAAFLAQFADGLPWAHVDIAGTMSPADGQFLAKGATGTGVRLLVELARRAAQPVQQPRRKK